MRGIRKVKNPIGTPAKKPKLSQSESLEKLRQFDLNVFYGPCIGMSRLDRWKRAEGFSLNPSPEIKQLLMDEDLKLGLGKRTVERCLWANEFE